MVKGWVIMNMLEYAQYCINTGYRGRAIDKARNHYENDVVLEFKENRLYNVNTGMEMTFEALFFDWDIELLNEV
jgi:hypothetical protein